MITADEEYVEIGTILHKWVEMPQLSGGYQKTLIRWSWSKLRREKGENVSVPSYDGAVYIPEHINYQQNIRGFYNLYSKLPYEPQKGEFPNIMKLMVHIFGDQIKQGLEYMKILYMRPVQKLPILLLVSTERNTGKTTFLNFTKLIFCENVTFNTNEDFRSQFNSDWCGKLLVCVDEVLLNNKQDSERLKNLSTAKVYKAEAKGKDRKEVEFFGKFILCSNNEDNPVYIEPGETRFWVRKVGLLKKDDPNFLEKLKFEIPAFLHYLMYSPYAFSGKGRMHFTPEEIYTDSLAKIINNCRNPSEVNIADFCRELFGNIEEDTLCFTISDLQHLLSSAGYKIDRSLISQTVRNKWKLKCTENSLTYMRYVYDDTQSPSPYRKVKGVGRFYTLSSNFIENL